MLRKFCVWLLFPALLTLGGQVHASGPGDTSVLDLVSCLRYAMKHQPGLKATLVSQQIASYQVNQALADWFPQLNASANIEHYLQLPVSFLPAGVVTPGANGTVALASGVKYTSFAGISATQTLYDRDVMLAARSSGYYRKYASESVDSARIDLVVDVSKAYYDIYISELQVGILLEDIRRLEQSLKDTYNQYQAGVVDKTDYKQAVIQLNTARVRYKQAQEAIPAKYTFLEQLIGFPADSTLRLSADSASMVAEAMLDTSLALDVNRRIEVQSLETYRQLQVAQYDYQRLGWIPSLSFFYNYNFNYGNNSLGKLYEVTYPNSYLGITLGVPIFQGLKRTFATRSAKLGISLVDLRLEDTKRVIHTQYAQAMAAYRGDLENWKVSQENISLSKEVYNTVTLQYKEGIKSYLDVITAEASLRTSEITGLDALFSLLSDKMDVLRATGTVNTNIN